MGSQEGGLRVLLSAVFLTVVLVGWGVTVANRHREATFEAREETRLEALASEGYLVVSRVRGTLPVGDPFAAAWENAPPVRVAVQPQTVTMPMLETASVDTVTVQGLTDGEHIAWRVAWPDGDADRNVDAARFCDAVALQFPLVPDANYMMGAEKTPVEILHWKALWQKDVDEHFQDVQDLHPNYWTDLYWFAHGKFPYPVPEAFDDTLSHAWFPAYQAGNPLADFHRREPVEELTAVGYGTLTHQEETVSAARGVWRDGEWAVVFARPLKTDDPQDAQFFRGGRGDFAVAVWEGAAGNVGGRKHHSQWMRFVVQS